MSEHEKINYVEFPSSNIEATKAFFSEVFGWSFQDFGPDYSSFSDAGLDGGFFTAELTARTANGSVLIVLYSNNLKATRAKVVEAGGSINQDIFSFPGGQRFHFMEPGGNELAVWSDTGT